MTGIKTSKNDITLFYYFLFLLFPKISVAPPNQLQEYYSFIESCLRHKSEMVIYEAAHAIVNMKETTPKDLAPAVSVLQLFLSSPKPTLRFAAVRTLNKVCFDSSRLFVFS